MTPATPLHLVSAIQYQEGSVVSKELLRKTAGTVTLFAFDAGQGLSEHIAPFDALAQIIDGSAEIRVGDETVTVRAGELLRLPAGIPHALDARERFMLLLTMVRA